MNRADWLAGLAVDSTPDIDECVAVLGETMDWLYLLEDTEQDPQWHAEGNVHRHTGMVMAELYRLLADSARHITGPQRQALVLSALLHDIGKPVRTRKFDLNGTERIGAPQHASVGRSYLAFKLPELELSFEVVWNVLNLVGEHHTPKKLIVNNSDPSRFYALARQANTELLYWLEFADIRGRICPDPAEQLQTLEEFRMFAEEYGVWGMPRDVHTELSEALNSLPESAADYVYAHALQQLESGKINLPLEAIGTTYQNRDHHSNLVVLCGPAGSGKSFWHSQHLQGFTVISLDDLRQQFNGNRESQDNSGQIRQHAKEQLKTALRKKANVVWDATNLRTDFRSVVCTLGRDYHALVTMVVFLGPQRRIETNNRGRIHSVPDSVLRQQLSRYQLPLLGESHQYQIVDINGDVLYRAGYYQSDPAPFL